MQRRRKTLLTIATVLLPVAGIAPAFGTGEHDGGRGHKHSHEQLAFGEPAPAAEPDRIVRIRAYDAMTFEPSPVSVEAGETVRFVVTNTGELQHSFTLGTPAYQRRHEKQMRGTPVDELAGHMDDVPNGIVVPPGESRTLIWAFEQGGPVQFACHIPGHYDAGMKGRIRLQ